MHGTFIPKNFTVTRFISLQNKITSCKSRQLTPHHYSSHHFTCKCICLAKESIRKKQKKLNLRISGFVFLIAHYKIQIQYLGLNQSNHCNLLYIKLFVWQCIFGASVTSCGLACVWPYSYL